MKVVVPSLALLLVALPVSASSSPPGKPIHREVPDMEPAPETPHARSAPWRSPAGLPVSVQVNIDANGLNILGDAANEPSLAVDPMNPLRIVIGWRQFDSIASSFRQGGYAYSGDGGATWTFPGPLTPGNFRSDPVLGATATGTFVYNSLSGSLLCDLFQSTDGGATWSGPTPAFGGDKQWMTIDQTTGIGRGNIYEYWSSQASCCGLNVFSRSVNGGATFDTPIKLPNDAVFGTLDIASDGTLYLVGADPNTMATFYVARSSNAKDPSLPASFDLGTGAVLGGSMAFGGLNPAGLLGQAWLRVNKTPGVNGGDVYILCSVNPPGGDPVDVMFSRSTDQGATFSAPIRVNDDASTANWQWFGTMGVAPSGRIDVVWNDTRNDPTAKMSELFYAQSTDGGLTFSQNQPVGPPFDPQIGWPVQQKIGDYYDIVSDNHGAHVAYSATYNGEEDLYYLHLDVGRPAVDFLVGEGYGPANPNDIRVFTGDGGGTGYALIPYGAGKYGTNVASGNTDGGFYDEILTGPGPGAVFGPHVREFDQTMTPVSRVNFFAYGTLKFGVLPQSGELDGDGFDEILTGAGPGAVFGPHVRAFNHDGGTLSAISKISFFAYRTLRYGVNPASGDLDRDDFGEIVTGPGPGAVFGPQVRGFDFDNNAITTIGKINFSAFPGVSFGARVASADIEADGYAEIAASLGPGGTSSYTPRFRGFDYDGTAVAAIPGFDVTLASGLYGGSVALGDVETDYRAELIAGSGPDPAVDSTVVSYRYQGTGLVLLSNSFRPFPTNYGVNVATVGLDL